MKKLIAGLLVCLMLCLPVISMGEGAQTMTLSFCTDAQTAEPLMQTLMGMDGLGEAVAELVNTLQLQLWQQPNGMGYSLRLKDTDLLGMDLFSDGAMEYLLISMMPDCVLRSAHVESADALTDLPAQLDFSAAADAVLNQCLEFSRSLDVTEEQGSFAGDAYSGGVRRKTFRLNDAELSRLLDACLTAVEGDAALSDLAELLGGDLAANISAARNTVAQAGKDNAYAYQVSVVYDEAGSVIGLSGTAMQGEKQVATLSLGLNANYVEAVWGYGYGGVNYYLRCVGIGENRDDGGLSVNLLVDMLADPQGLGYRAVAGQDAAFLEGHAFALEITPEASGYTFDAGYEFVQMTGGAYSITVLAEGAYADEPFDLDAVAEIYLNNSEQPVLTANLSTEDSEIRTFSVEGLHVYDADQMDDAAWEEFGEAMLNSGSNLMVKLFKLLPAQLLAPLLY